MHSGIGCERAQVAGIRREDRVPVCGQEQNTSVDHIASLRAAEQNPGSASEAPASSINVTRSSCAFWDFGPWVSSCARAATDLATRALLEPSPWL